MTAPQAVLFDLDGTLTDTVALIAEHIARVLDSPERPVTTQAVYPFIGQPLAAAFEHLAGVKADEPRYEELADDYRAGARRAIEERGPSLVLPGVVETLDWLRERGTKVGVVTAKNNSQARHLLDHTNLTPLIDIIVGTDDVARGKPAPDPALLGAKRLGVAPGECVYVGDAATDVQMALAANMECWAVTTGASSAEELHTAGAAVVVDRLDHLIPRWSTT